MRDARLNVRLEAALLEDAKKYAKKKGVSVASVVASLLSEWVVGEKNSEHVQNGLRFEDEAIPEPEQI